MDLIGRFGIWVNREAAVYVYTGAIFDSEAEPRLLTEHTAIVSLTDFSRLCSQKTDAPPRFFFRKRLQCTSITATCVLTLKKLKR